MRSTIALIFGCLFCTALGCQTAPSESPQSARLTFAAERYPAVFEAAVETLRQHDFRIARRDYRFGTITTFPKESATAIEYWIDDATTSTQRQSDTLNSQQRTVTVKVKQPDEEVGYSMTVEVLVERLERGHDVVRLESGKQVSRWAIDPDHPDAGFVASAGDPNVSTQRIATTEEVDGRCGVDHGHVGSSLSLHVGEPSAIDYVAVVDLEVIRADPVERDLDLLAVRGGFVP